MPTFVKRAKLTSKRATSRAVNYFLFYGVRGLRRITAFREKFELIQNVKLNLQRKLVKNAAENVDLVKDQKLAQFLV